MKTKYGNCFWKCCGRYSTLTMWKDIKTQIWTESESQIFVAEDGEVVGFLSVEVHNEPERYIYLDDFSVTETKASVRN